MNSVNAVGSRISTRIRQANFDPLNVEMFMYMGKQLTSLYGREIKKSTWSQLFWKTMCGASSEMSHCLDFNINGMQDNINSMDYLLAFALEAVFPAVTVKNTAAPVPFVVSFGPLDIDTDATEVAEAGEQLYYYLSDGSDGLPAGTLYVGTQSALTSSTGINLPLCTHMNHNDRCGCNKHDCHRCKHGHHNPCACVKPFISYCPRHRVSWGHHTLLAAIDHMAFMINDVEYEELSRHALYNALQFRMRQDVYPVAGDEATTLDAVVVEAGVGNGRQAVLGGCEDDRYKAFIAPFSFTTSALADRGDHGNHRSAFPVLLACREIIRVRVHLIDDLRKLLILEEEVLPDFSHIPIIFVATPLELGVNGSTTPVNAMYISDTVNLTIIPPTSFGPVTGSAGTYYATSGVTTYTVIKNGTTTTYSATSPFTASDLGVVHLEQTGCFLAKTRPTDFCLDNPFSCHEMDYRHWIHEDCLKLEVKGKAFAAIVTDLERGMMKADCRSKKYLYERYNTYCEESSVKPGDKFTVDISPVPGQFKYAYTFAQNEISRLQGHYFNYTNDTDYCIVDTKLGPRYRFEGKSAISHTSNRVQGFRDEDHKYLFLRYVDNPLFAQRAPRELGLAITPRYANWINSIQPDGSINAQAINDLRMCIKTRRGGNLNCKHHPHHNKCNTFGYNLFTIAVSWNLLLFELDPTCKAPLPPRPPHHDGHHKKQQHQQ